MQSGRFRPFERLKTSADFSQVFDHPQKTLGKNLLILWKPGQSFCARIGVIAGKKVSKLAVSRNRIRRVIRNSFRLNKNELGLLDIIVIARQSCAGLSSKQLRHETDILWKKLKTHSQKYLL